MPSGRCSYPPCPNTRANCPGYRLHRFPVNKERAMQWAINCQSPELIEVVKQGYKIYNNKRLCSQHFERPCFMNDLKISLTKLAVPTIFTQNRTESTSDSNSNINVGLAKLDNNSDHTTEEVQQLRSNKPKIHFTLAEIIAETVGLDKSQNSDNFFYDDQDLPELFSETNPIEGSEEFHVADIDLPQQDLNVDSSEGTQAFYQNNKPIFASVTASASKNAPTKTVLSVKERTAVTSVSGDASKELLCRLCANLACLSQMVHIFGKSSSSKEYLQKINQLLPASEQPDENDLLPKWICSECCERLNYCDQAIHDFISASVKLNRLLSTSLSKRHRALMKTESASRPTSSNSRSATRKANANESVENDHLIIKEERLDAEQFEERLLTLTDCNTKQQHIRVTNTTTIQQTQSKSMPHASQKGNCMNLCSTNSVLAGHSHHCACSQCIDKFSDKCSRLITTLQMKRAKNEINVVKKPQTMPVTETLDSQDYSFSESVIIHGNIQCPVKRKSHQLHTNDARSTSVSSSPKVIKIEGVHQVDNSKVPKSCMINNNHLFSSASGSQSKKLEQDSGQGEFQGKIIQSSHTIIPTANDNKTFVCEKCDISFSSIESALTHRFKEHPEEILRSIPK